MTRRAVLSWALAILVMTGPLSAAEDKDSEATLVVVVHPRNPVGSMGREDLRSIFKKQTLEWRHGGKIAAFNLRPETRPRIEFDQVALGFTADESAKYWIDQKLRGGQRPPRSLPSASAILTMVSSKQDAIGYVPESLVNRSVRVVARIRGGKVIAP